MEKIRKQKISCIDARGRLRRVVRIEKRQIFIDTPAKNGKKKDSPDSK